MAFCELPGECIGHVSLWWAIRKLGIDKWLVCLVYFMYMDVRNRIKVGQGELGVKVGFLQGYFLSRLL